MLIELNRKTNLYTYIYNTRNASFISLIPVVIEAVHVSNHCGRNNVEISLFIRDSLLSPNGTIIFAGFCFGVLVMLKLFPSVVELLKYNQKS